MTLSFKKATLGTTEYGLGNGTKLSVVKYTQTPISILDSQHLSYIDIFEIDCDDSIVKEGTITDLVWEIQSSLYNSRVNFSTAADAPFSNEAIQSDNLSLGDHSVMYLLATARCANEMFGDLETPVAHPVIAIMFLSDNPSDPPSLNSANIMTKAGIEITADDIKKDGVSIIGGGHPEATDEQVDYNNPSSEYLVMTPAQVKAMIDAVLLKVV